MKDPSSSHYTRGSTGGFEGVQLLCGASACSLSMGGTNFDYNSKRWWFFEAAPLYDHE